MGKFVITKRKNGEFQFNLQARNGEIILTSEGYTTSLGCRLGIMSVREHSSEIANFHNWDADNGEFYFTLNADNGEPIGVSQMYDTAQGRAKGIQSVMENGQFDQVEDLT
ncbi:hypothetical protein DYBT9623_00689 [Dyadobacter sp. CECT 9623]|uniref:DUF1508 domain-containing protein n=1 Tax=Dyadobacter linearis TaxID=2823330 RepID=A0ABM8UKC6_9BACT|nr:YegP family protein [Dyadobacter sp. CECT 9623]CAG5067961.1 hypothetical protein DYBT9623_00689 [Dyadobacter sp. CECT 9623]